MAAVVAFTLAAGGCSVFRASDAVPPPSSAPTVATPAEAAASAAAGPGFGERALYKVEVEAPRDLRTLLLAYLDLSRFQNAPAEDGITSAELDRLIGTTPAQARGLLETQGYFNAEVSVRRDDAVTPPLLTVLVTPGPRATISSLSLSVDGALQDAADAGDAKARDTLGRLQSNWSLKTGASFDQADWNTSKNQALALLRAQGYPSAIWAETSAAVDAPTHSVRLRLVARSGPLYRLGPIRIEGIERYSEQGVRNLAGFYPGAPYNEKTLLDFQERLQKVGLYEGVSVELDASPATASAAPVLVKLREQPLHQLTLGVGVSANTGPRVTGEHLYRKVFGLDWQAKTSLSLGTGLQSLGTELTSYPLENQWRNLAAAKIERLNTSEEERNAWSFRVGRGRETEPIDRLYYVEVQQANVTSTANPSRGGAITGNGEWVFRKLDSILLPTVGHSISAQLGAGFARSSTADNGPFARALARVTFYQPLGGAWLGQFRLEGGQVFSKENVGVPDTLLFRAGGDDSVRGYAYRSLGPVVNGETTSARVLFTSSAEFAHPIVASLPALLGAVFVDAGNAADTWGELRPAVGFGVGLHYRSPVGPLRLDLAYGEKVRQIRLHLSVGVTF
jgi:translocation and assembly module TamA